MLPDSSKAWAILGQSFGGFCCVEYLSKFPSSAHPRSPRCQAASLHTPP